MKQKGIREPPPPVVWHHETTHDERLKVITLRNETGMSWADVGRRSTIHKRTKGSTASDSESPNLKAYNIGMYLDIP